ncbi:MAG TPA: HAD family phosphatase [Bacillota bacterium]|nr:HAD family phosphatase [Bacillota bacterium]
MQAIIFDLDGTLIDSMMVWDKVCQDYLAIRGIPYHGDIGLEIKNMSFLESALYYIEKFALRDTVDQIIDEWQTKARQAYAESIALKEGVREFLAKLQGKGIKLAVATSTDRELVELVLNRHGILPLFQIIVTVQEAGIGKDNPDFFRTVAKELGVKPEACLVFDDCLHAVYGAKKAGMKVWAVYDERSVHERPELERIADRYIESFKAMEPTDLC